MSPLVVRDVHWLDGLHAHWLPLLADGISHALIAPSGLHRLGDGWSKHGGIEVFAHALDDLTVEERIGLRLARQFMPFRFTWPFVSLAFIPDFILGAFGCVAVSGGVPSTASARNNLGHPQPIPF